MGNFQTDLELALHHLKQVEKRIREQRDRVEALRSSGASTENAEDLLVTLIETHNLLNRHLGRVTSSKVDKVAG